jgi:periplasmic protein TonB
MKQISKMILSVVLFALTITLFSGFINIFPNEEDYKIATDGTPTPIGGYESIMKKIVYPDMAVKTKVEGKIYLLVYLSESGEVDDIKVVKGIGAGCDEEAVKAVRKSKFTPATQNGAKIKSKFALALSFKLPN